MDDPEPVASPPEPTSTDEPPYDAEQPETRPGAPEQSSEPAPAAEEEDRDEEGDLKSPIDPDSLRADPRVAREMYGALYTDITAYGPTQAGSYNTMNNYFAERRLDPIIGELPGVEALMMLYVATHVDEELDDRLSQRSAVCLVGPRNSGRFSTARAALGRRYQAGNVYEIALPTGLLPEALVDKPSLLPENSGFVLRLAGNGHVDAMRKLAPLFRGRRSTLLLIKDEESPRWARHGSELQHHAPDPIEVFRSHLRSSLPLADPDILDRYLRHMEAELKAVSGPKESVALAKAIAKEHPADKAALDAIVDSSQPKRRERAAAVLLPSTDEPATRGRRAGQHERAFRLSYAVFHRRPMHYVFEAADWLLREIDSAALRPDWGSMALQHPVRDLLGELKDDWQAGRDAGNTTRGASRIAWIRDEGLRGAIIDVAWHEFDGTRTSLLNWLSRLVTEGDAVMRQAAAETAGLLVHHDFKRVHQELVDVWAKSPRADVRQAAAWAMTYADMPGDITPLVRAKLNEWCSGPSSNQRDTAARLYASGLEQTVPAWSMFDLARIARDRQQKRRYVVAEALYQIYRPERATWFLTEMAAWTRTPLLQIHAARLLPALAARVEVDRPDGRPELLERLAEGTIDIRHVGRLWLVAFLEPDTALAAADALARWIRHADTNREFRGDVVALLSAIGTVPAMRRRIDFYLHQAVGRRNEPPEWMREERRRDS